MRGKLYKYIHYLVLMSLVLANFSLFFPIPHANADAVIRYANSSTGNDANGCTIDAPCKTFTRAYAVAVTGDTINLTGTFTLTDADETGDTTPDGFTISKNLTISGQDPQETVIQAASTPHTTDRRIFTLGGYTITLQNLTIRNGNVNYDSLQYTSAIDSNGTVTLTNLIIDDNSNVNRFGGAAVRHSVSSKFIMRNTTISNSNYDTASWDGYTGALYLSNATNAANEITNCTFFNNLGGYNGGIYSSGSVATITNSTFINNRGSSSAADIYSRNSGSNIYIKNNIFADKGAGAADLYSDNSGIFTDGGYNIIETYGGTASFTNGVNGNIVGDQANLNISHTLEDNNSIYGSTTLALSSGSVAINAGNDSTHNGIAVSAEDQRGASRPDTVDIGAFEYNGYIDIPEPTTQATNVQFSDTTYKQSTISWTNGNGSRRAVFIKAASSGSAIPVDTTTYTANTAFGSGTQIGPTGWYCVYNGTGSTVTVTNLFSNTTYSAFVTEYNGTMAGTQNYYTATATENPAAQTTPSISDPTTQASNLSFSSISGSQASATWTNGSGDYRVVFMKAASSGTATPVDTTTYTANSIFGSGTQIGSTGWYCVYYGIETSVTVTGLSISTNYRAQVFEFYGVPGDENYNASIGSTNPRSFTTKASVESEGFESGNLTALSWSTSGNQLWAATSGDKNTGTYSAANGDIGNSQSSTLQITLDIMANGNISFYKKVSSESCCDKLRFYIDNILQSSAEWGGTVAWSQSTYAVTAGSRTFKWTYSKDGSVSSGSDTAWLDDIAFPQINPTTYLLEYLAGANGTISGTNYQNLQANMSGTAVSAVPNEGYSFINWSDASEENPRTDENLSADLFLTANFSILQRSLVYSAGTGGSVSGSASQVVNYGANGSAVTAVPAAGYHFVNWSDGSTINPRTDTNITSDVSVTAQFTTDEASDTASSASVASTSSAGVSATSENSSVAATSITDIVNESLGIETKETPPVYKGEWKLISSPGLSAFIFSPLPPGIQNLTKKFPSFDLALKNLEVFGLSDVGKIAGHSLPLSSLSQTLDLPAPASIDSLSEDDKEKLPTEIVFVQNGAQNIDFDISVSLKDPENPEQIVSAIAGKNLKLVTKPAGKVNNVTGKILYRSEVPSVSEGYSIKISNFFTKHVSAKESLSAKLLTLAFEYSDQDMDGIYTAEIMSPALAGEYEVVTSYEYSDEKLGIKDVSMIAVIDPEGYIYEKIGDQEARISNAKVILLWRNPENDQFEEWTANKYSQVNPQTTGKTGEYSFLVPDGEYQLLVTAKGYRDKKSEIIEISQNRGVSLNIELVSINPLKRVSVQNLFIGFATLVSLLMIMNKYLRARRKK